MSLPPDQMVFDAAPPWQEQDERLRELWMRHLAPEEIATILGRTVSAVMTRAARLGLPRRLAPGRKPGQKPHPRDPLKVMATKEAALAKTVVSSQSFENTTSTRVCLMCLEKFESAGRHNRICAPCKGSGEYATASALPDIQIAAR